MIVIRDFVKNGGTAMSDSQLLSVVRERMPNAPTEQQHGWLREVELVLDGYATKPQLEAAARLRGVLALLAAEVRTHAG